jgi:Phycobilisome degradation protein nblA
LSINSQALDFNPDVL